MTDTHIQSIGFTATRTMAPTGVSILRYQLIRLPVADRYVSGGARGGDAYIGWFLAGKYPKARHTVIVPADRSQVNPWWQICPVPVEVIEMPEGTTYKDRNQAIVEKSGVLAGFPAHPEDHGQSRRSGTWQTIRIARKEKMPVTWHTLMPPFTGDSSQLTDWRWGV